MGRVERSREIARRRTRRTKVRKLRKKFEAAKTEGEKIELQKQVMKVSPFVVLGED